MIKKNINKVEIQLHPLHTHTLKPNQTYPLI